MAGISRDWGRETSCALGRDAIRKVWELRNIYHHHPESKKRKSSEANSGSNHPDGRDENAVKTRKALCTIVILWACEGHFREEGRYGGGRYFDFP